ncbi:HNH endonuclease family protein [Actinokineospora sp. PR83]|uniref:HNH endonuclease family protein n=1 Tax=Actinokineospora sp. PR83 TaxID=2884908 RepID=UPI0027DF3346|nr:DUF1524 domain-containing protein [Actinokineospora sp. PR83]MCG8914397.1 HNH endonuclease family protein [Actinokineospora sp. PR83]
MNVHRCIPVVLLALLTLAGCKVPTGAEDAATAPLTSAPPAAAPVATGDRAALMAQLGAAKPEDTGAHYNRDDWGDWAYDPKSKCNTREQVLARDGQGVAVDSQCRPTCPTTACWTSRYDGVQAKDAADLQIDHIVPIAEANRSGARGWSAEQRNAYYNDMTNLVAVSAKSNGQKSDSDPAEWRPVDAYSCEYATAYTTIKVKYHLTADDREIAALNAMLNTCPR